MRIKLLCICLLGLGISSVKCQELFFDEISEVKVKALKRGNTYQVRWTGGNQSDPIVLELVNGNQNFGTWEQSSNPGKASVRLPTRIKPGNGYYFRIIEKESNLMTSSPAFAIRRKIPLGIQLAGAAAIPLAILILACDKGEHPLELPTIPNPD